MTPSGMKFSTLAGTVGGGVQTPGFIGHSKHYIGSKKFISAEGGARRIVWMNKSLKEEMGQDVGRDRRQRGDREFCRYDRRRNRGRHRGRSAGVISPKRIIRPCHAGLVLRGRPENEDNRHIRKGRDGKIHPRRPDHPLAQETKADHSWPSMPTPTST